VVVLVVSTAKVKRMAFERQRAIELSQLLIENKISYIKNTPTFWDNIGSLTDQHSGSNSDFPSYLYNIHYVNCNNTNCKMIFTVNWGLNQSLSVERLFSKKGL
jgi:hypothetical protein